MNKAEGQQSLLQNLHFQDTVEPEPDLDSTSFFADGEYLDNQELSYSQKVERINALLLRNNLNRPILYRILAEVEPQPLPLSELEARIYILPGFETATQPPFPLIEWLINVEALHSADINEEGEVISDASKEGKTADEIDDMIVDQLVEITEFGRGTLETFDPAARLADLMDEKPQRSATYLELLNFLKEKRSYGDIDCLLRGNPILMDGVAAGDRPMQPSVFVDKLASVGAIVYEQGWLITPEGLHILEG